MSLRSTINACVELARLSNLPTTISNVLVGAAAGLSAAGSSASFSINDWVRISIAWLAIACFYIAGMAMNDLFDVAIDRVERPERPIVSGRISKTAATLFIVALLVLGLVLLAILSAHALVGGSVLVGLIVTYNLIHRHVMSSVILLGLSRGLIYPIAAVAVRTPQDWSDIEVLSLSLAAYTAVFSIIARGENDPRMGRRRWMAVWLPIMAITPLILIDSISWQWAIIPAALALAWIARGIGLIFSTPPHPRRAIMTWIAGISLIDAMYLTVLNQPMLAVIAIACFVGTVAWHRRIAGT